VHCRFQCSLYQTGKKRGSGSDAWQVKRGRVGRGIKSPKRGGRGESKAKNDLVEVVKKEVPRIESTTAGFDP